VCGLRKRANKALAKIVPFDTPEKKVVTERKPRKPRAKKQKGESLPDVDKMNPFYGEKK
jgi:hypothetical protein